LTALSRYSSQLQGPRLYTYEFLLRLVLAVSVYAMPTVFRSDVDHYFDMAVIFGSGSLPYADFTWEFPPLTVFALLLGPLTADSLTAYRMVFVGLMVTCEWSCLQLLRRFDLRNSVRITAYWTAVVVPLSLLAWYRLDFVSVLFMTLALTALLRGRPVVHWIVLGFLAKLWPVLICVALFARRQYRVLAWALGSVAAVALAWYAFSPDGFREFLHFRKGAGFQIESLPGAVLHHFGREFFFEFGTVSVSDSGWKWLQPVMFGLTIVSVGALAVVGFMQKRRDDVMLVGACIALTLVFSRIISPQFLVWLAPFIVLRLTQCRAVAGLYAATVGVSLLMLFFYDQFVDHTGTIYSAMQIARNLLLVALAVAMTYAAVRPQHSAVVDTANGARSDHQSPS
jgi:hypothetical protein